MAPKKHTASYRIQQVINGPAAELIELALSKQHLISTGIIRLAQSKELAEVFFSNPQEVEAILVKYGIGRIASGGAKLSPESRPAQEGIAETETEREDAAAVPQSGRMARKDAFS